MLRKNKTKQEGGAKEGNEEELGEKILPYSFEKELIQNQNKRIYVNNEFIPVGKIKPIEPKFYARFEQKKLNFEKFIPVTEFTQRIRRTKLGMPLLESQVYGWMPDIQSTNNHLNELNKISAPKCYDELSKFNERVSFERITERPKFNGLRFFV